ncbi:MAG: PAS domain S-box protein, partial [Halobacteriaceae archaeon]
STDEQERLEEEVLPELRSSGNWRGEVIGQRQDGTTFPQTLSLTMLDDGGMVCVVRDITERKERQQALEETQQQYETIVEESRDGIRIVQDGTVVFANERLAEMLDTSKAELIGNPSDEMVIPEQEDLVRTRHTARMEGDSLPDQYEVELDTPSEETMYVELSVTRIQYQGDPASLSIIRDITDRKEREKELERSKAYLDQTAEAISVLDTDGRIQYESPAVETVLGYEPTERVGELALDYVHPDDRTDLTEQ